MVPKIETVIVIVVIIVLNIALGLTRNPYSNIRELAEYLGLDRDHGQRSRSQLWYCKLCGQYLNQWHMQAHLNSCTTYKFYSFQLERCFQPQSQKASHSNPQMSKKRKTDEEPDSAMLDRRETTEIIKNFHNDLVDFFLHNNVPFSAIESPILERLLSRCGCPNPK